jgi:hypothetical protein
MKSASGAASINSSLSTATGMCLISNRRRTPMKVLWALMCILCSCAASAQTTDAAMIAEYYLDDCWAEISSQSTSPAQIVTTEPTIANNLGDAFDEAASTITEPNDAPDVGVSASQPSEETSIVGYLTPKGDKLTVDDTTAQGTPSAQITEPATGNLGEIIETGDVTTTGPIDSADVPVGAMRPPASVNAGLNTAH